MEMPIEFREDIVRHCREQIRIWSELLERLEGPRPDAPASTPEKTRSPEKKKRPPTEYNMFMKDRLVELRREHPELPQKERFRMAMAAWKTRNQEGNKGGEVPGSYTDTGAGIVGFVVEEMTYDEAHRY